MAIDAKYSTAPTRKRKILTLHYIQTRFLKHLELTRKKNEDGKIYIELIVFIFFRLLNIGFQVLILASIKIYLYVQKKYKLILVLA